MWLDGKPAEVSSTVLREEQSSPVAVFLLGVESPYPALLISLWGDELKKAECVAVQLDLLRILNVVHIPRLTSQSGAFA